MYSAPELSVALIMAGYLLVIPSDMMSVILQQEETILILSLSTTRTCGTVTHRRPSEGLHLASSGRFMPRQTEGDFTYLPLPLFSCLLDDIVHELCGDEKQFYWNRIRFFVHYFVVTTTGPYSKSRSYLDSECV